MASTCLEPTGAYKSRSVGPGHRKRIDAHFNGQHFAPGRPVCSEGLVKSWIIKFRKVRAGRKVRNAEAFQRAINLGCAVGKELRFGGVDSIPKLDPFAEIEVLDVCAQPVTDLLKIRLELPGVIFLQAVEGRRVETSLAQRLAELAGMHDKIFGANQDMARKHTCVGIRGGKLRHAHRQTHLHRQETQLLESDSERHAPSFGLRSIVFTEILVAGDIDRLGKAVAKGQRLPA